jgi:dihydroorotate dehydrogenase
VEAAPPAKGETRIPRLPGVLSVYRLFIRPFLFRFDAESMHHLVVALARFIWRFRAGRAACRAVFARRVRPMPIRLAGIELANPLGLAAGFDKNGALVPGIESLGFGFVEVGTVTPRPQFGNPRPRLMRVPGRRALVNRMGFNNDGAEIMSTHLRRVRDRLRVPVGVNLGKNRDTPNSEAVKDYEALFKAFHLSANYFVINISSPNTPGLRDLQTGDFVRRLGSRVQHLGLPQPVFVKLAPDVPHEELKEICQLCGEGKPYAGLILTNTIPTDLGGLSGFPLKGASTAVLKVARTILDGAVPIISVGGIESADDVIERFANGANAVQLYTAMIYGGPSLPGRILRELQSKMRRRGITNLSDLRSR